MITRLQNSDNDGDVILISSSMADERSQRDCNTSRD